MANEKWEFGIVNFYEPFLSYDRYTSLSAATASQATTINLNATVASNYAASPVYLKGSISKNGSDTSQPVYGGEVILGPSSDSTYSGAVEKVMPSSISSAQVTLTKSLSWQHVAFPQAAYASGDPVIIRTVPLGWQPAVAFESQEYAVFPIGRYGDNYANWKFYNDASGNNVLITDYKKLDTGVRLVCNHSSTYVAVGTLGADEDQRIYKNGSLNSFSSRIRSYRASWYARVVKAAPNLSGVPDSDALGVLDFKVLDAAGTVITLANPIAIPEEDGYFHDNGQMMRRVEYRGPTESTGSWVYNKLTMTPYHSDVSAGYADKHWIKEEDVNNPSNQAINRGNRWGVHVGLLRGVNTAFDVDDIVIEHAHGTSKEMYGYYQMDDWPTQGSVSWEIRNTFSKNTLLNGSTRSVRTNVQTVPKYTISAEFDNVDYSVYRDMLILANWQNRGQAICFRPKGYENELPPVMVGFMTLTRPSTKIWSNDRVSFGFQFEEA